MSQQTNQKTSDARSTSNTTERVRASDRQEQGTGSSRPLWLQISAITAMGILARVPYITTRSIWYDEASSWQTAQFSMFGIVRSLRMNVHLPLYYWLLKPWMAVFGDSPPALRGFSVLFGVVTVAAMYFLAREYLRTNGADEDTINRSFLPVGVALVVALNAFQVNASMEARMYSLGTALSALSTLALFRAIRVPGRWLRWIVYGTLATGLLYTHHHCLFVVASQFVFLAGYAVLRWRSGSGRGRILAARSSLAAAAVGVAYIPGSLLMLWQLTRVRQQYWIPPINNQRFSSAFIDFIQPLMSVDHPVVVGLGLAVLFVGAAVAILSIRPRAADAFLALAAFGPMALAAAVSITVTPVWVARYFRFSQLFLLFVLVAAIWKLLPRSAWRAVAASALVLSMAIGTWDFWKHRQVPARPGMRGAMEEIVARQGGIDLIVVDDQRHYFPAKYYAPANMRVTVLDSVTRGFWDRPLVRAHDVISTAKFRRALERAVWRIGMHPDHPATTSLSGVVIDESFRVDYDFGSPQWAIWVSRIHMPDQATRIEAQIESARSETRAVLDFAGVSGIGRYSPLIGQVESLHTLSLDATAITDEDLRSLEQLPNLVSLSLVNTDLTDAAARSLQSMQRLETLDLDFTAIGDATLESVASLPRLSWLSLAGTRVTDDGLSHLEQLPNLEKLSLSRCCVTDRGCDSLAQLISLKELSLDETQVSDDGIKKLYGLRSLEKIRLWRTSVTENGVAALEKALPNLDVSR